jgi:hypothetical protein
MALVLAKRPQRRPAPRTLLPTRIEHVETKDFVLCAGLDICKLGGDYSGQSEASNFLSACLHSENLFCLGILHLSYSPAPVSGEKVQQRGSITSTSGVFTYILTGLRKRFRDP